jgi:hypothetical protein
MDGEERTATGEDPSIVKALKTIRRFVRETTGEEPEDRDIARALCRYFVLNEIKEHIVMAWETDTEEKTDS